MMEVNRGFMDTELKDMDLFNEVKDKPKAEKVSRKPFGIDLGTTNSAISVGIDSGDAQVIQLMNGKRTMPSVVMWQGGDNFIVGQEAYEHDCDDSVVSSVKRLMQDNNATVTFRYNGEEKTMTPTEVSAEILKGLVSQTGGIYGEIKDVVVTVPAYFNQTGVENTKKACELAGLNCLHVMREPTAAALNYDLDKKGANVQYAIVYDLGGGTFDVSLIRITSRATIDELYELYDIEKNGKDHSTGKIVEPQAIDGDGHLGGDDYDYELYKILVGKLDLEENSISRNDARRLQKKVESAKRSPDCIHEIHVDITTTDGKDVHDVVKMEPIDFVVGFMPIYTRTKKLLNSVLRQAQCPVNTIVLMGGSTKTPILIDLLKKDYPGYTISDSLNPDESVAQGAGKKARDFMYGDADVQIFDILPQSIGILAENKILQLIKRNSQIPTMTQKLFKTITDNQEFIRIRVFQGNSTMPEECAELGELRIDGLPPKPAGEVDAAVMLTVNSDCILSCKVAVEGQLKEIKLSLNADKETSISNADKSIIRWKKQAERMQEPFKEQLLTMIAGFGNEYSKEDIARFIREHKTQKTYEV